MKLIAMTGDNPREIKTRCHQRKPSNEFQLESRKIYITKHLDKVLIIRMSKIPLDRELIRLDKDLELLPEWPTLLQKG
jgi:hypothetical protein